ncbi:hypothetical protein [Dermacoccus sp. NHGro5]|uniref:hypothetical protein n=1 Tax=Dermacoccus sp. NHGro5 TaxID=2815213 RepID=UPI001AA1264F|nr:hypothetical protein [Dermacoccus sp. NHGro5]MBO1759235.1 hypothetical protein [Dermacoccus sp. NHGro5]
MKRALIASLPAWTDAASASGCASRARRAATEYDNGATSAAGPSRAVSQSPQLRLSSEHTRYGRVATAKSEAGEAKVWCR